LDVHGGKPKLSLEHFLFLTN
jgi:hypothetical protein